MKTHIGLPCSRVNINHIGLPLFLQVQVQVQHKFVKAYIGVQEQGYKSFNQAQVFKYYGDFAPSIKANATNIYIGWYLIQPIFVSVNVSKYYGDFVPS
jgi:hypothetical protein